MVTLICSSLVAGCETNSDSPQNNPTIQPIETQVALFCGDCHAVPQPESFARDVWYDEIRKGYEFYARSGRSDLHPPALASVVRYYRERAPKEMVLPELPKVDEAYRQRFTIEKIDWRETDTYFRPGVASVWWNTKPL